MNISLSKLIEKYYNELNYLGTSYSKKNHKQYVRIENIDFAENLISQYNNLELVYGRPVFAPEIKIAYITLK